jgi:hypothetical protein
MILAEESARPRSNRIIPNGGEAIREIEETLGIVVDVVLPRCTRGTTPELDGFEGNETEEDRRLECESVSTNGTGDAKRLRLVSVICEAGRKGLIREAECFLSMAVPISRRVSGEGASSSSLMVQLE